MTYEDAICYIHSMRHGGPDFSRMRAVLERLGNPDRRLRVIHVAGTNGKGSVCAFIDSILRAAGYRTGLFTSPYVTRFNERIRVDGEDIPDEDLARVTEKVRAVLEELDAHPAEFELVTLLGLEYFCDRGVDAAVVEVGMGGVHDATNVISRTELSVICSIGLDHTQYLGNTLEEIAQVKAGIIRERGRCAAYSDPGGVIGRRCRELGAELRLVDFERLNVESSGFWGSRFDFGGLTGLEIPLAGDYQPKNAALALTAAEELAGMGWSISEESLRRGLERVSWPGRLETVRRSPMMVVDGGHNPPAAQALARSLRQLLNGRRAVFALGVMADKDAAGIVDALRTAGDTFVCVRADVPRAMNEADLANLILSHGSHAITAPSISEGVKTALQIAGKNGFVCAAGSLYILNDARLAAKSQKI